MNASHAQEGTGGPGQAHPLERESIVLQPPYTGARVLVSNDHRTQPGGTGTRDGLAYSSQRRQSSGLSTPRCQHNGDKLHAPDYLAERRRGAVGAGRVPGFGSSSARWTPCAGCRSLRQRPPPIPAPRLVTVPAAPGPSRRMMTAEVSYWEQAFSSKTLHWQRPCPGTDVGRYGAGPGGPAVAPIGSPGAGRQPGVYQALALTTGPGMHRAACPTGP